VDFTAILGALPTLGPIGLVLLILGYVGKQWISSDSRYKSEIERLTTAHDLELTRIQTAHSKEITDLRADIDVLRREMNELRMELGAERSARMLAQEEAHRIRLQSGTDKS
jgi:TolA-binding protein